MSFLASIYLWLLPITFIPIIFHFLKKRNYKNIKFSTTRFLFDMKEESLKRINLINILLLIIRTLIILFLILMISKPVYNYSNRTISDGSDTIILLLVDDSYSNYKFINDSLNPIIKNIHKVYNDNATIHIRGFSGKDYLKNTLIKDIKFPLNNLSGLYGSYNLSNKLLEFNDSSDLYLNKDIYIISDLNDSIISDSDNIDFNSWNVFIYEHKTLNHNIILKDLVINENIISNNKIISLMIDAVNITNNEFEDIEISLFSNNIKVSENIINFNKNEIRKLEFQTSFPDKGTYNCYFKINDYTYYFNLNVDVEKNIALVYSNIEDTKYVKNALLAFNDLYENLSIKEYITENILNTNEKFDSIIKFGTEDLDNNITSNLLIKSPNLVVVPIQNFYIENLTKYFKDIKAYKTDKIIPLNNISLSKDYKSNEILNEIFKSNNTSVKINKHFALNPSDNTLLYINNQYSFLDQYVSNNNNLYLLTIPLDIESSTLPLSGSFIPFLNYLIKLNDFSYYDYVDDYLPISNIYNEKSLVHKYNNSMFDYTPGHFKTNNLYFTEPGFHKVYSNNQLIIDKSINISQNEINNNKLTQNKLKTYFDNPIIITSIEDLSIVLNNIISGLHLWKFLLYAVILLLVIEMYISNIYLYKNND